MQCVEISTETNQAQSSLLSGMAKFICSCCVRIKIIYPNRPCDIIPCIQTPKSDFIER
jgi:hypothetical protein